MKLSSFALVAVIALSGCAASIQRPDAERTAPAMNISAAAAKRVVLNLQLDARHPQDTGWQAFRKEWQDIAAERAGAQGVQFSVQDGAPNPTGQDGTLMVVRVNDYRHVGIGSRMLGGIMTGNAFIDCKVEFRNLKNGELFGERSYNTSSSAGQGVFSAMTPKQLYAITDETLAELKRR